MKKIKKLKNMIHHFLRIKFFRDVSWNFLSLIIIGISGLLLNFMIGAFFGAKSLGVFNQVMTIFVLTSQISTFGIHFSVQAHIPPYADKLDICAKILNTAFFLTFIFSCTVSFFFYKFSYLIGTLLDSHDVAKGLELVSIGILLCSLNKILSVALNGLRHMRLFAFIQSSRVFIYLIGTYLIYLMGFSQTILPIVFTISEFLIFIILFVYILFVLPISFISYDSSWYIKHIIFGFKSILSGFMADINPKIDILILGYFAEDKIVGVYSFASLLAEGITQIPIIVQTNLNPIISVLSIQKNHNVITDISLKCKRYIPLFMLAVSLTLLAIYPIIFEQIKSGLALRASLPVLSILLLSVVVQSGYIPLNMYLNQAGYPHLYSLYLIIVVAINFIFNFLLVPIYFQIGAALGTLIASISSIYLLKYFIYKVDGIKI